MPEEKPHEILRDIITALPNRPGVYQYYDKTGKIIYVGKAKDLKKRVSSYFISGRHESGKTALLVKNIVEIRHIVVANEYEALLLENSMIKKHQPRFNIQLRDDKTYPWICIKNERYPRVFPTRHVVRDGSEYFGPYASGRRMRAILAVVNKLYKIRNCTFALTEENVARKKFKVCLEYHIGNCLGPCEAKEEEAHYNQSIREIRNLIKGDVDHLIRQLETDMKASSAALRFEEAAALKERADLLRDYQSKSVVVNPTITNVDIVTVVADDAFAYANFMHVVQGAVIQSHSVEFKKKLDESEEDIVLMFLAEMRSLFQSESKEVISNVSVSAEWEGVQFHVPQRGDKKALVELSLQNVRVYMIERHRNQERTDPERHSSRILKTLQTDLRMKELPMHMECFDNSNFHGSFPVAACIVFKNAKPSKADYRHFSIKTVEGPNDFASMEEVIYRRYKRMLDENQPLPQLIVVDGGKGQLSSAVTSLERLGLRGKITIVGIAKRLEEIYFPDDAVPLYIDKRSESLKIIQRMRNEAHRFGITHHRNKRSKNAFQSELLNIAGVGERTAKELLRAYGSVERIKNLTVEELCETISQRQAVNIHRHYHS